jgi:RimJ/RimL family protein N-acetyltransferase
MPDAPRLPLLRGAKVWLRALEKSDVVEADLDDRDLGHFGGFRVPFGRDEQERWYGQLLTAIGSRTYQFNICPLGERRAIGSCGLRDIERVDGTAEASIFVTRREDWGRGYGTDAMNALLDFGFGELRLERIELDVYSFNARGRRSYEKAGFTVEGTMREAHVHHGEHVDVHRMSILLEEWRALPRSRGWELNAHGADHG